MKDTNDFGLLTVKHVLVAEVALGRPHGLLEAVRDRVAHGARRARRLGQRQQHRRRVRRLTGDRRGRGVERTRRREGKGCQGI